MELYVHKNFKEHSVIETLPVLVKEKKCNENCGNECEPFRVDIDKFAIQSYRSWIETQEKLNDAKEENKQLKTKVFALSKQVENLEKELVEQENEFRDERSRARGITPMSQHPSLDFSERLKRLAGAIPKCKVVSGYDAGDIIYNVMSCGTHIAQDMENEESIKEITQEHIKECK